MQHRWLSLITLVTLECSVLTLGSCKHLTQVGIGTSPIAQVLQQKNSKSNNDVTIRGEVVTQVTILKQGAYLLKDSSGLLWVATEKPLPPTHSTVTVRGKTQSGVVFASINSDLILSEIERL